MVDELEKYSFYHLVDTIKDINKIRTGGEDFKLWAEELLRQRIEYFNVLACGGLVVPQIGNLAAKPLEFFLKDFKDILIDDPNFIKKTLDRFWDSINEETVVYDLKIKGSENKTVFIISPIFFKFDKLIGYLWVICEKKYTDTIKGILEYTSTLIALLVYSEKISAALEFLAKPIWIEMSTKEKAASEIAKACMEALSCRATIIWEVNERTQMLIKIAAAGDAEDLNLDMQIGTGVAGKCIKDSEIILIDDLWDKKELSSKSIKNVNHPELVKELNWHSAIFVPLDIGGQAAGVIAAYSERPRGFYKMEVKITLAFAQRLSASYVHLKRLDELMEIERRINLEASTIETGFLAIENVHDTINDLGMVQNSLNEIIDLQRNKKESRLYREAISASKHVDSANKTLRALTNVTKMKKLIPSKFNLSELINDVVIMMELEAEEIGAKISVHCPADIIVKLDKDKFKRVISNFINNSLFFLETDTKGGQRQIDIHVEHNSEKVIIRFKDNGPGIAPYDKEKIFNYFFTTKGDRGMGFGLAISKNVIEKHGGKINVQSKWGRETEFIVEIPLEKVM